MVTDSRLGNLSGKTNGIVWWAEKDNCIACFSIVIANHDKEASDLFHEIMDSLEYAGNVG